MSDWTPEQIERIKRDPQLSRLGTEGLDARLTPEERDAVRQHLTNLANQRRRVEAESCGLAMP